MYVRDTSKIGLGISMSDEAEGLYERLLVLRCQTGDDDAYRELVSRFGPRLRYFLLKLSPRPDRADDLVQETWIDVLRQLPRLKDAGAFRTWLYRIAHGKALLDGRLRSREPETSPNVDCVPDREDAKFSPDDASAIHAALDELEPAHREVLVLRFLEELSYAEIALIVDCPVGTVRSRIYYAKSRLQRMLHDTQR
jgi:RNA polymerase sigma-70 factor, ECF subfamily